MEAPKQKGKKKKKTKKRKKKKKKEVDQADGDADDEEEWAKEHLDKGIIFHVQVKVKSWTTQANKSRSCKSGKP